MANPQNLKTLSPKEAREQGRKGGKASAKARQERKTLREGLLLLLNEELTKDGKPTGKTTQDAIIAGIVKRAANGDTRAFEIIRDTIGEKPVEHVNVSAPDKDIMTEVARRMAGDAL